MAADDCIFCRIAAGQLPATVVHETDSVIAFRDVNPRAPTHVLVIPRRHISTVNDLVEADAQLVGEMYLAAKEVARIEGIADGGYRLVLNVGQDGGQAVWHIHLHVLGGRRMTWPPG